MDDIKLYAKNERDIDLLIHIITFYSNDSGMSFRKNKCRQLISKRGKMITAKWIELQKSNIADVQDNYKYHGTNRNYEEAVRLILISRQGSPHSKQKEEAKD